MAHPRIVAVLDVGKTNVKGVLHDLDGGSDLAARTMPNVVRRDGPYPHVDTDAIGAFFLDALADFRRERAGVDAISITAHGAAGALLGGDGLALPVLDYEFDGPDSLAGAYDRVRPPFAETCSPRLPCGLNLGAQIFWQSRAFPDPFARVRSMVGYAQFWAWWMTGVAAQEVTALGAHTDLWNPRARRFSSMVEALGWAPLMAPLRSAFDRLGPLKPDLARRLGFDRAIPVACGLHDSNASLLPHLLDANDPVTVVSTGTWVIAFATGGSLDDLDAGRDMLANVDAYARPIPSARFMGGREFEILAGPTPVDVDAAALAFVLGERVLVRPTFSPGIGPFPSSVGCWSHAPETLTPAVRTAAATLYLALVTATSLRLLKARGPTVVEGPFARNPLYLAGLRRLTARPVLASRSATGTVGGAALLFRPNGPRPPRTLEAVEDDPLPSPAFDTYARAWTATVDGAA